MSDSEVSDISDINEVETKPKTRAQRAREDVQAINAANVDNPKAKRRNLVIHQSDAEDGDRAVFVGVNGYGYHIPRGKTVSVPEEVIEALNNAVVTRYTSGKNGQVTAMDAPRYAFSVS